MSQDRSNSQVLDTFEYESGDEHTISGTVLESLLEPPIAFNVIYARICGSITAGLLLSQAVYWTRVQQRSGNATWWFFKTQAQWQEETFLTRREQETARRILREKAFIQEEVRGKPPKLFFRVDLTHILTAIKQLDTQYGGKRHIGRTKPPSNMAESAISYKEAETTSETTTENTSPSLFKLQDSEFPVWLPVDEWKAYLDMRKKLRKPATDHAQQLLLKKLTGFYESGLDITAVLQQSIVSGWTDLYAPKNNGKGNGNGKTLAETVRDTIHDMYAKDAG